MYELVEVTERSWYIESPAKIGVVVTGENEACLIDSGGDRDAGRRVLKLLNARGLKLRTIYNTHSNADHIGGNRYLQNQTGCAVYAPGIERDFTVHPVLEPSFLYGGYPCGELRHKFLLAQESKAELLTDDVLPEGFRIIPLPGHFFDMVGFRTPDDVVYLADCLSSRETVEKYRVSFVYDVAAYLDTLEKVRGMSARMFVPAHAAACEDVSELAQFNIDAVNETAELILDICGEPKTFEEVLRQVFKAYGLTMTFEQYALVGSTVRSYLSWLHDSGRLAAEVDDARLMWRKG